MASARDLAPLPSSPVRRAGQPGRAALSWIAGFVQEVLVVVGTKFGRNPWLAVAGQVDGDARGAIPLLGGVGMD